MIPDPRPSFDGPREAIETLRSLSAKWRAEGARIDSFHATMGTGYHACAADLDRVLSALPDATEAPAPQDQWLPIETCPAKGPFYVTDGKRQMVADGGMLLLSKQANIPQHLSGNHWTHWAPCLPLPSAPRSPETAV